MMTRNLLLLAGIGIIGLPAVLTYSAEGEQSVSAAQLLRSTKEVERKRGQQAILEERRQAVDALIEIVTSPRAKDGDGWLEATSSRNLAIACLGKCRAPEAVEALVPLLGPAPGQSVTMDRPLFLCPAGEALVEIGRPAVSVVVASLAEAIPKTMSAHQARVVLCMIEATEGAVKILEDAIAAEKDEANRANLEASLKIVREARAGSARDAEAN